jgi:hypothetical protein
MELLKNHRRWRGEGTEDENHIAGRISKRHLQRKYDMQHPKFWIWVYSNIIYKMHRSALTTRWLTKPFKPDRFPSVPKKLKNGLFSRQILKFENDKKSDGFQPIIRSVFLVYWTFVVGPFPFSLLQPHSRTTQSSSSSGSWSRPATSCPPRAAFHHWVEFTSSSPKMVPPHHLPSVDVTPALVTNTPKTTSHWSTASSHRP